MVSSVGVASAVRVGAAEGPVANGQGPLAAREGAFARRQLPHRRLHARRRPRTGSTSSANR